MLLAFCIVLLTAPAASARTDPKKGIWGPVRVNGTSQFPVFEELGATIYNAALNWNAVARRRPVHAQDPHDRAYRWPADLNDVVAQARRHHMRVAVRVSGTPPWANGGRTPNWVPNEPADYADFVAAAARRYPSVRFWIIWGEPTRAPNFSPIPPTHPSAPLTLQARRSVRFYARLLDGAYAALKRVSRRNTVIGGNSFTGGDISPLNWIRYMRLANGRRPRMDLYGHNPFTARRPRLLDRAIVRGYADFSDLDDLSRWLDRYYGPNPRGKPMRIWIGEWLVPTDHANHEFNFWVTRKVQAAWLRAALRIVRRWSRIYAFNWLGLYDEPARPAGDQVDFGLIDGSGRRKSAFRVFQRG